MPRDDEPDVVQHLRRLITHAERPITIETQVKRLERTTHVAAVSRVDEKLVGKGAAGPLTLRMNQLFMRHIVESCLRVPVLA